MIRHAGWGAAILAAVALLATPAEPQQQEGATGASAALIEEVSGVNRSLQELVVLLQEHLGGREIELMMKRIELKSKQLGPLEATLRQARSDRADLENEAAEVKLILDQIDTRIEDDPAGGTDEDRRIKKEVEGRLKLLEDRKWNAEQQILDLEQDLMQGRETIKAWEELVDTRLDLR